MASTSTPSGSGSGSASAPSTKVSTSSNHPKNSSPINLSCHCGTVRLRVPRSPPPSYINECQCSLCRRYSAAWAYYPIHAVQITATGPTNAYLWGDEHHDFNSCAGCGCVMFWRPVDVKGEGKGPDGSVARGEGQKMGVNTRCVDEVDDLKFVERRVEWVAAMKVREGVYDEKGRVDART